MAGDSISTFPGNSVVLIESPDPSEEGAYFIGSGVVIGPHTILTASHVVFDTSGQLPDQDIVLYPGWDSADPAEVPATFLRLTPTTSTKLARLAATLSLKRRAFWILL
jgi:hypothetical protein